MNSVMTKLHAWLDDEIDDLFYLENERKFLKAVGIRGHREFLK